VKTVRDYQPAEQTRKSYVKAFYITIIGNLLLVAVKAVVASLTGSAALYAETANSASDVVYSLLMVFGLWISQKPPDHSHPQGHSRFEPLVGLLVTFSMAFAGYQAASTSILKLLAGGIAVKPGLPTLVLAMTAITKGVMYYAILQLSQKNTKSSTACHSTR